MLAVFALPGGDWWEIIPLFAAIYVVMTFIFQLLWNTTMTQVFQWREITFWQAFRLILIAGILFGGSWVRYH